MVFSQKHEHFECSESAGGDAPARPHRGASQGETKERESAAQRSAFGEQATNAP